MKLKNKYAASKEIWIVIESILIVLWTWRYVAILFFMFLYSPFKNINRAQLILYVRNLFWVLRV